MSAGGNITVSGGTVTATGNRAAINAGTFGFTGGYATAANRLVMAGDSAGTAAVWTGTDANDLNGTIYKYVRITPVAAPGGGADVPQTGDGATPLLWAGLLLLAGAGLVILRKRRAARG